MCWAAPPQWRNMVNELKFLGKRSVDDRELPECPDQRLPWVIRHKLKMAKAMTEEDVNAASPLETKRQIDDNTKEQTVDISEEDLAMLRRDHPEVLELLMKLCEGSEVAAWQEEADTKKVKDSVLAREDGKKRRVLKEKAGEK